MAYAAVIAWLVAAATSEGQTQMTVCPSKLLYHIPCPGCGITRATILVSRGHFLEGIRLNPNVILCMSYLLGYPALALYGLVRRRPALFLAYKRLDGALKSKSILLTFLAFELVVWICNVCRDV